MADENEAQEEVTEDTATEESEEAKPELPAGIVEVTAKIGTDGTPQTVLYDFGTGLEDAVEKFTDQVVFTNFRSAAKVTLQAAMRRYIKEGKDVQALASTWKPGVTMERIHDPKAAMIGVFKNMDDTARAEFLQSLRDSVEPG